jgi:hypothetical protein
LSHRPTAVTENDRHEPGRSEVPRPAGAVYSAGGRAKPAAAIRTSADRSGGCENIETTDECVRLYHGTHVESAAALEAGATLDAGAAAERHLDGEVGFYLASEFADAEFFAARRSSPSGWRVVAYDITEQAFQDLLARGATFRPIPADVRPTLRETSSLSRRPSLPFSTSC